MTDAEIAKNCRDYIVKACKEAFSITDDLLAELNEYDLCQQYYIVSCCFEFFKSSNSKVMLNIYDMLSNDKTESEMELLRHESSKNKIALVDKIIIGSLIFKEH